MVPRSKKLDAIHSFTALVSQVPAFTYLMGFLAGAVDRVHFLKDLTGAEIAITVSISSRAIWPHEPFKAFVRGVAMPNPYILVRSIWDDPAPICVSLDFDHADETPWYQEVLLPSVAYVKDAEKAHMEESDRLRQEMDRTLDIYRECKTLMKETSPERERELAFYMHLAEERLKTLSRELEELNQQMQRMAKNEV